MPSLVNLVVLGACIALSYRRQSIQLATRLFLLTLTGSAMAYAYQTGGVGGYGVSFMLTMPFVAQLFSTKKTSFGIYLVILGYLWFLLAAHGFDDQPVLMKTIFHALTLTGLLGISLAFAVIAERGRLLLEAERQKAEAANEAKSAFLANTSHEVRTPLNGILGMAEILKQDELNIEQQERVDIILDSGETLLSVLNNVLDLSKIEAGRLELSPGPHELARAIRNGLKLWEGKAREKRLYLEFQAPPEADAVLVFDPVRVRQCLANLVSNAIKFTNAGGVRVRLEVSPKGSARSLITLAVADTGIGLSEAAQERLFNPFSQANSEIGAKYGGTGLGLSISRQLARMMGGDLTVASVEGQGATFTLSFTAEWIDAVQEGTGVAETGTPLVPPTEALAARDVRVLLVDDNPINRKVARGFLKIITEQVSEAQHGAEALSMLRESEGAYDLVLLDMNMPIMDGPETIASIRGEQASWSEIPAIALTADAMSGDRERYLAMGLSGYISKPIDRNQLLTEINLALAAG